MPGLFTAHVHEYGPRLTSKELVYLEAELRKFLTFSLERRPKRQADNYFISFGALTLSGLGPGKYLIDNSKRWQQERFSYWADTVCLKSSGLFSVCFSFVYIKLSSSRQ